MQPEKENAIIRFVSIARAGSLAACLAIGGSIAAPAVAIADTASTAAIAAGIGAIVGTLIYDSNRHQYYYVRGNRRQYVDNGTARQWYQHRDPGYYNAHRQDFQQNPGKFDRDYRNSHHGGGGHGH